MLPCTTDGRSPGSRLSAYSDEIAQALHLLPIFTRESGHRLLPFLWKRAYTIKVIIPHPETKCKRELKVKRTEHVGVTMMCDR